MSQPEQHHGGVAGTIKAPCSPQARGLLTSDVQRVEEAGVALGAALQVAHEGQRGAQQPVRVLAAAQQHRPGVGVQVFHCGGHAQG